MLTDRRPILLANARVVDPSRAFDGPGDVLIADGMVRDSRRGIGAAGVPEGTDIANCAGRIVAPGLIRDSRGAIGAAGVPEGTDIVNCARKVVAPGLIDMRAFVGEPVARHS